MQIALFCILGSQGDCTEYALRHPPRVVGWVDSNTTLADAIVTLSSVELGGVVLGPSHGRSSTVLLGTGPHRGAFYLFRNGICFSDLSYMHGKMFPNFH